MTLEFDNEYQSLWVEKCQGLRPNCVINLSSSKRRVFKEAFKALKLGGRLMVSDLVLLKELPEVIKNSVKAYIGCLSRVKIRGTKPLE